MFYSWHNTHLYQFIYTIVTISFDLCPSCIFMLCDIVTVCTRDIWMTQLNVICADPNYILFLAQLTELTLRPKYKSRGYPISRFKRGEDHVSFVGLSVPFSPPLQLCCFLLTYRLITIHVRTCS